MTEGTGDLSLMISIHSVSRVAAMEWRFWSKAALNYKVIASEALSMHCFLVICLETRICFLAVHPGVSRWYDVDR